MSDEEIKNHIQTSVLFGRDAQNKLFVGLEKAAQAVTCTLGPKGKTVIISQPGKQPIVTKDGVTVSKAISFKDPIERMGAELIKEAASQTNDTAGDGTTTATLLTYILVKEGLRLITNGSDATKVSQGIKEAVALVVENLKKQAVVFDNKDQLMHVATISANGDSVIGSIVADALSSVGTLGIVTVEDAKGMTTALQKTEGMFIERGYLSPYFVTHSDKMHVAYDNARVLVTDGKLSSLKPLIPILEKINQTHQSLLIIADDVEGEALQSLVLNKLKNNLKIVAIKTPGYGLLRDQLIQDIAIFTGAQLVSAKTGLSVEKIGLESLGTVKKLIVDAKSTTVVADPQSTEKIKLRADDLLSQLEDVTLTPEDVQKLRIRLARLASGAAVIKVGGATEIEMVERKHRIEDALHATRAAAEEGIVPGGGYALFVAAKAIEAEMKNIEDQDVKLGYGAVVKACEGPVTKIAANAAQPAEVIMYQMDTLGLGYDAAKAQYVVLMDRGIIDPLKVTRTAIVNASSVANVFLSLDAAVIES